MPSPVHPYSDYGVALRTLRSARGWLGFMLFACVVWQFVGFALMYWTQQPYRGSRPQYELAVASAPGPAASAPAEESAYPGTGQSRGLNIRPQWDATYTMIVPVTQLAALIAVSSQSIIIFITLLVVLIAQAPGVAQMTRSLIWSVLLLFIFFPWQYFAREFPIPGVLYSYSELLRFIEPHVAHIPGQKLYALHVYLLYGRFMVWPIIGLFVLLITAESYRGGIMIAIGHPLQSILQARGGKPMGIPEKKIG